MNRTTLIVIGLIIGAAIGWFTAPKPAVDIQAGGLSITVEGDGSGGSMSASNPDGTMQVQVGQPGGFLPDPGMRALVFGIIGAAVGFGISAVAGRRTA